MMNTPEAFNMVMRLDPYGMRYPAEYIELEKMRLRERCAIELFDKIKDGKIYTVRIEEVSRPDVMALRFYVGRAETMRIRVAEFDTMDWPALSASATDEVKRRAKSRLRKATGQFTGWVKAIRDSYTGWIAENSGW